MKSVYGNVAKKYEEIVGSIIVEPEHEGLDFPLTVEKL
jgi:hypothetical protein